MVIYMRAEDHGTRDRQLYKPLGRIPAGFSWSPKYVSRLRYVPFLAFPESKYPVEVCTHAYERSESKTSKEKRAANRRFKVDVKAHGSRWDSFLASINSF